MTEPTIDAVRGDTTGLMLPAHPAALLDAGEDFLTAAFQASGWLTPASGVSAIRRAEPVDLGSTGQKLLLTLDYHAPGPETELFVKFSRDFGDVFRDRRRFELEPEIRFAELSRLVELPVAVPAPVFADFHRASGTGLLITPRIPFGNGVIEPQKVKYMDRRLADPMVYYRTIVTALARLAAAHKTGGLSPHVERLFPYDPDLAAAEDALPWSEAELRQRIGDYAAFAERHPALLPAVIRTQPFLARFEADAVRVLTNETAIKRALQSNRDMIALGHFNAQIDNAWFWRDDADVLQCGLFDWQRARQMNVAYALWGALSGMSPDLFEAELDPLLAHFVVEFEAHGGPSLELETLHHHFLLYMATMGLAGLIEAPKLILRRLPEAADATGPFDPIFERDESARSFLHILTNFLTLWRSRDVGRSIDSIIEQSPARSGQAVPRSAA